MNLIWRHPADPAFTSENPGKRQPQMRNERLKTTTAFPLRKDSALLSSLPLGKLGPGLLCNTLQPGEREAWAGLGRERGQGCCTGGLRTQTGPLFSPCGCRPLPRPPRSHPECSCPHFLQPWEAAGMRKARGTQGGSGPAQALAFCTGHTALVQPTAQTVDWFSFSCPFGVPSSLTLSKLMKCCPHPKCGREVVPLVFPE